MGNYEFVLFDLDGTLTDSGPGIMNGFAYTVQILEERSSWYERVY